MERSSGSRRRRGQTAAAPDEGGAAAGEDAERARTRARSAQASRVVMHTLIWVLLVFFATDYLPPLIVRGLAPGAADRLRIYLVGYTALGGVCLVLGAAFGTRYARAISRSSYPTRWFIFPTVLAVLLIPAQGWNEWLSRGVEVLTALAGIEVGVLLGRRRRPG